MKKAKEDKCKSRALYLVPWAGKQVKCCEGHARSLSALGNVMGSPIQVAKVNIWDICELSDDLPDNLKKSSPNQT
ncbi:MAG TPA: hypothetical protein ENI23_14025 [bacterium]|nr:hypothetical protein [bacterium]